MNSAMILQPATKQDFDFRGEIYVDAENKGFTQEEIERLAGAPPDGMELGAMGISEAIFAPLRLSEKPGCERRVSR